MFKIRIEKIVDNEENEILDKSISVQATIGNDN